MKVNKRLLPLKVNYFLFYGCLGPVIGFLPTIARQLGYSLTTFGALMTVISLMAMVISPLAGVVIDKFSIKRKVIFTSMITGGIVSFLFMYIPKVPTETGVELKCDSKTNLVIYSENVRQSSAHNESIFIDKAVDQLITCKLDCDDPKLYDNKINEFDNQYNTSGDWKFTNSKTNANDRSTIVVEFNSSDVERNESSYVFDLLSVQINGSPIPPTTCQWRLKTFCHITCSNDAITDLAKVTTYRGNVIYLYQFWIFCFLVCLFSAALITSDTVTNAVCLDLLEDKTEDYGKQKLWASIGWGFFSIFIGWLVDQFSTNAKEKNYSPVYYSCMILTLCNVFVTTKIKISESKKSKDKMKSVYGLFSKHYVIAFYLWSALHRFFHTIITHFLFWYMEDLVCRNNEQNQQTWLKTLQGLAQGMQCFGGEIPFFFWSGGIIRKMGHVNCMALTLGAMAVRMYLYTVIWNPAWFIAIEMLNGVSYALGIAVKMSYAKLMSPPDTTNTIIGFMGLFDCIGDSLASVLGGYLFDSYGGVWTFRFFAYGSALTCFVNILSNHFGFAKELKNSHFTGIPTITYT